MVRSFAVAKVLLLGWVVALAACVFSIFVRASSRDELEVVDPRYAAWLHAYR